MTTGERDQVPQRSVLVVGTEAWAVDRATRQLQQAGHRVVSCPLAEDPTRTCATLDGSACDLDGHLDVVLVVRARPLDRVVRSELGAVCALRRGTPLVLAGAGAHHPFADFAATIVDLDGDVVGACLLVAASGPTQHPEAALDRLELEVRVGPQPSEPRWVQHLADPVPVHGDGVAG